MTRLIRFGGTVNTAATIDFATRAEFSIKKEYFSDFVFSGTRDKRIYGLTKISPSMSVGYDVNGARFLGTFVLGSPNVVGTTSTGVMWTPADLPYTSIYVDIDGDRFGITSALCDSWELTAEAGNPVKAEANFTAINWSTVETIVAPYTADFSATPFMLSDCKLTINATNIDFQRFNLKVSNNVESIFKADTIASTIRLTGLEVEGRIRVDRYGAAASAIADGPMTFTMSNIIAALGTIRIIVPTCKITEIPPKATGFEVPETEYAFIGYPSATDYAISCTITATGGGKF